CSTKTSPASGSRTVTTSGETLGWNSAIGATSPTQSARRPGRARTPPNGAASGASGPLAGTAVLGRLTWLEAKVASIRDETARVKTLELDAEGWTGHRAGQHLDVRLTAEDGYQAERSYSIASAPGEPLEITVERLEDGEVSPYLVDEVRDGDVFEVRGPIGGYFVWDGDEPEPVLLVGGGSGIVPLAAMARHRARVGASAPMKLLYSSRSW